MALTRNHVPLTSVKRVGSVEWENEFKHAINELLEYSLTFEDVEGYIQGLDLEYVAATQVSISTGGCICDTVDDEIYTSSSITINLSNSGVNGLDTGTVSANWYYIWVIKNPTSGLVRGLASLSDTSPTMPSGYTKKRLLGAVRYDGTTILKFFQQTTGSSRDFLYEDCITMLNGAAPTANTWTNLDISAYVPTSSKSRWGYLHIGNRTNAAATSSTTYEHRVRTNGSTGTGIFSLVRSINGEVCGDSSIDTWIKTDSSGLIQYQRDTTINVIYLDVLGYRMEI